jgi:hypothetical protein
MFIVMLVGGPEAFRFFAEVQNVHPSVILIADEEKFYEHADLFVYFGGEMTPGLRPVITWSGDDLETLRRIHEYLVLE